MRKKQKSSKIYILFLAFGILFSINCNSQITFVQGYYIDNSNNKISCLIKNVDWENNPSEIEYKTSELSENQTLTIESIKEFGIGNVSKYIRVNIDIDRSNDNQNQLSYDKNPVFKQELLLLKVLIEGSANLYLYKDSSIKRYFYKTTEQDIEQLVFKEYKISETKIGTNYNFRRQLFSSLKCNDITNSDLEEINYKKAELLNLIIKYNNCTNLEFINYEEKAKTDLFNINIRPGLNVSSLSLNHNGVNLLDPKYDSKISFRFGVELEFILGFNKNKWAVILEPTYQYFKSDQEFQNFSSDQVDYQSIEFPIGIRHYLFLKDKSKLFLNSSFIYDLVINSKVRNLEAGAGFNMAIGIGYNYNNRYSIEIRYHTKRNILPDYNSWTSSYKTSSIIFGYSVF